MLALNFVRVSLTFRSDEFTRAGIHTYIFQSKYEGSKWACAHLCWAAWLPTHCFEACRVAMASTCEKSFWPSFSSGMLVAWGSRLAKWMSFGSCGMACRKPPCSAGASLRKKPSAGVDQILLPGPNTRPRHRTGCTLRVASVRAVGESSTYISQTGHLMRLSGSSLHLATAPATRFLSFPKL